MSESTRAVERWLPVVGWESTYEVSDLGRVRSLDRLIICRNGVVKRHAGRILTPTPDDDGRPRVTLCAGGRSRCVRVYRLVLTAFRGPCPPGMEGCHDNGDASDSWLGNLRWDTPGSNHLDRVRHGVHNMANRTHCPQDHRLVPPNLVLASAMDGRRHCLACNRAYANRQHAALYGHPFDFTTAADEHYRLIMSGCAI